MGFVKFVDLFSELLLEKPSKHLVYSHRRKLVKSNLIERLLTQIKLPQKEDIIKLTVSLQNALAIDNKPAKIPEIQSRQSSNNKELKRNKIWRFLLESTSHPSSPFFPMIAIFEYYLFIATQKQGFETLDKFLFNVSCLDLRTICERQMGAIRKTIIRGYHTVLAKWNCEAKVRLMVQHYRLDQFIQGFDQVLGMFYMQEQRQQQILDIL